MAFSWGGVSTVVSGEYTISLIWSADNWNAMIDYFNNRVNAIIQAYDNKVDQNYQEALDAWDPESGAPRPQKEPYFEDQKKYGSFSPIGLGARATSMKNFTVMTEASLVNAKKYNLVADGLNQYVGYLSNANSLSKVNKDDVIKAKHANNIKAILDAYDKWNPMP